MHRATALVFAFACLLPFTGCSDSDGNSTTVFGEYQGMFANTSEHGTVSLMIPSAGPTTSALLGVAGDPVSGTLTVVGGSQYALSGFIDGTMLQFSGGPYSFIGDAVGTQVNGTYTGPSGSGEWAAPGIADGSSTEAYCGTYSGDDAGYWDFIVVDGTEIFGASFSTTPGEGGGTFTGTLTGGSIVVNQSQGATATGTVSGGSASGTWANSAEQLSGTWSGSSSCGST